MPTRAVSAATMKVGKKGGGKHWTVAQVAARKAAAKTLERRDPKKLVAPGWLCKEAKQIWARKVKETEGVELLDVLDGECLAIYCDAFAKYQRIARRKAPTIDDIKALQAYMRIVAQYAEKLGFTPGARARLIKKRAEEQEDPFGKAFDK